MSGSSDFDAASQRPPYAPDQLALLPGLLKNVSIRDTEQLAGAGIACSVVDSVGDSDDHALVETSNEMGKAGGSHRRSWKSREAVELVTLDGVHGMKCGHGSKGRPLNSRRDTPGRAARRGGR